MREILFRGKQVNDGMWIQGYLFQFWGRAYILWGMRNDTPTMHEVKPETIGQFTGLTDKNGERIFEGDIISTDLARDFLVVEFRGGAFVFNCNDGEDDYYDHINASHELDNEYKYGQIIGNIHDQKEEQNDHH